MTFGDVYAGTLGVLSANVDGKVTKVDLLADLKSLTPVVGAKVFLTGKTAIGDGLGGFYYWDAVNTTAEDTVFMNVIPANNITTGRWVRAFQKARVVGSGTLVTNGGVKTLYVQGATNSSGDATVYLTDDGTANGNALFTAIWFHDARANVASADVNNSVSSFFKSLSADLKTLVYGQFKPNPVTITLGLAYAPAAPVGAGTTVLYKVEGI